MKVVINDIKKWKKSKKEYNEYCKKFCEEGKWKRKEVFLKLFDLKSSEKCKKVIKEEFREEEIKERGIAYYLFCDKWKIVGKKDNKEEYIKWERYENPEIKELKKIMKKNNYERIELRAGGFYYMPHKTIVEIVNF